MTDATPGASVDQLLDAFIAAWNAGQAPSLDAFVAQAAAGEQEELTQLIAAFLQIAPTVEPSAERGLELAADPLVQKLTALERDHWDALEAEALPWGVRLRGLREAAGLSVAALGAGFAERFALRPSDAERAPAALAALEAGSQPADGVAARAARVLEELLSAPRGALAAGAAPAFGGPMLRGALPESPDERERFADLLRQVDDALALESDARADEPESLEDLLG